MSFKPLMHLPQTELLLRHFKSHQSISPLEAQSSYRIKSLARRINDLEAKGHVFRREQRHDGAGQRYVRYTYLGQLDSIPNFPGRGGNVEQVAA